MIRVRARFNEFDKSVFFIYTYFVDLELFQLFDY